MSLCETFDAPLLRRRGTHLMWTFLLAHNYCVKELETESEKGSFFQLVPAAIKWTGCFYVVYVFILCVGFIFLGIRTSFLSKEFFSSLRFIYFALFPLEHGIFLLNRLCPDDVSVDPWAVVVTGCIEVKFRNLRWSLVWLHSVADIILPRYR